MGKFWNIVLLSFCLIISSCAAVPAVYLSKASRKNISSVTVDKNIKLPDHFDINASSIAVGSAVGGVVGGAIASSDSSMSAKAFFGKNNINVSKMLYSSFMASLSKNPFFENKINDSSKTKFILQIRMIGLDRSGPFSLTYRPTVSVYAELVDKNGNVLWGATGGALPFESYTDVHDYDTYIKSPAVLKSALAAAFSKISKDLVDSLSMNAPRGNNSDFN